MGKRAFSKAWGPESKSLRPHQKLGMAALTCNSRAGGWRFANPNSSLASQPSLQASYKSGVYRVRGACVFVIRFESASTSFLLKWELNSKN